MQLSFEIFQNTAVMPDLDTAGKAPEQISLSAFLADPGWRAVPDPGAKGEYKGMWVMVQPDGKEWNVGSWIGKFRNEVEAKKAFHRKRVYWAIHRGEDVPESVLSEYPDLLQAQRGIHEKMASVQIKSGPYVEVSTKEGKRHFHILDAPIYGRVQLREFITDHLLAPRPKLDEVQTLLDEREQMAIALERVLKARLPEDHRPHLIHESYDQLLTFGCKDIPVRFRIPEAIDEEGYCTKYRIHEGKTAVAIGCSFPVVVYEEAGELKRIKLYPSQVVAIRTEQGWIEFSSPGE